jgi:hypothetical protein
MLLLVLGTSGVTSINEDGCYSRSAPGRRGAKNLRLIGIGTEDAS